MHIRKFQSGLPLLLLVVITSSLVIRMLSQRVNKRRSGAIITTSTTNAIVTIPTLSQFNPQVDLQFITFVNAFSSPSYIHHSAFVCFTCLREQNNVHFVAI